MGNNNTLFDTEEFNCDTTEQCMNDFIDSKLIGEKLWHFLNHVRSCPACYEELETRYLLSEALERLEDGESINIVEELKRKLTAARFSLRVHLYVDLVSRTLEMIAAIILGFALISIMGNYFGF